MSRLIAIDPGLKSGVAIFDDGKLFSVSEVLAKDARVEMQYLECYVSGQNTVAIEEQYMGAGKAFKSIRTLIEIAGFWRLLAEIAMEEAKKKQKKRRRQ